MNKNVSILRVLGIFLFLTLTVKLNSAAQNAAPQVIPALQQWRGARGELELHSKGVITISDRYQAELKETANLLAQDLSELMGWTYEVKVGRPMPKGIHLTIGDGGNDEEYTLNIKKGVVITGAAPRGVLWGTRTLLQMLYMGHGKIAKGVAKDKPQFPNRGFMLDVARKFFTMDYLKECVKVLSFYKMNEFQIHLNDNGFIQFYDNDWSKTYSAFRLESDTYPGLTSKDGSYSKEEFRAFQEYAARYGVTIIPEIDIPAHSLAFVHYNPKLGTEKYGMDHLDLYNPETYTFVDALLAEYITGENPTFINSDVHIGTDEYNVKEAEKYRAFTDRYLKYIEKLGKTPRMWGGLNWLKGNTPVKADGVIINAWSKDWVDPVASLQAGYQLINSCDTYLYIVPAAGYYRDFLDHKWLYEEWSPWIMNSQMTLPEGTKGVLGAMFAVWNDKCGNGISEQDVHYRSFPAIQVLAEKMWKGRNKAVGYDQFEALCRMMPEAPGVNLLARLATSQHTLVGADAVQLNGKEMKSLDVKEVGYPYSVSFEINPSKNTNNSGILFHGPHSTLYTNWENTGRLSFSRDGYTFVFQSYRLPEELWTSIRIDGDYKGTSLYVNGELVERLEGREMRVYKSGSDRPQGMKYQETLIFPLAEIGSKLNGFQGSIKNLVVSQGPRL